ncbi:MAG: FtsX-like permease family protein, partial [Nocardioides sp.]
MTRLRWLLATALRGLWSRRVLSAGSLLLTVIAIASAVVGPSYQVTAADSFVIEQLAAEPTVNTGLTFDYRPTDGESPDTAIASALDQAQHESGSAYLPGHAILWDPLPRAVLPHSAVPALPTLVSAPGACAHVELRGRCPTNPGEVAVLRADATTYRLHLGSRLAPYGDTTSFTVVGIYRPPARDDGFWFSLGRLETIPPGPRGGVARPAPWLTPQVTVGLRHDPWYVTVDQRLAVTPRLTPGDAAAAAHDARAVTRAAGHHGLPTGLRLEPGNALPSIVHRLLARRGVARATVEPAVLSLVLVALVLLSRLLAAAMGLRRGELALASLRGYGRRQLWFLGMLEPLLILIAAIPGGVLLGYLTSRYLAHRWLVPGLPVPFVLASGLAVVAVALVTGTVAAVVVRDAVNEPLSSQIAGVRRPTRAGRGILILRLALVAAALAALVTAWSRSRPKAPDATDLALPMLLAIAVGLLCSLLVLG